MKIAETVKNIVAPIIDGLNTDIELIDVEYIKEGSEWYLRVYIDKKGGVTLDDCQLINDAITDVIDQEDPIKTPYIFEVSSPGIDRPLKTDRDFERYKGTDVEIHLYAPIDKSKLYIGKLSGKFDNQIVIIDEKGKERSFDSKDVSLIKRTIIWN